MILKYVNYAVKLPIIKNNSIRWDLKGLRLFHFLLKDNVGFIFFSRKMKKKKKSSNHREKAETNLFSLFIFII